MLRDPIALKLGFRSSNEDLKNPIVFFFLLIAIEASVHLPLRFLTKIQKTPLPLQFFFCIRKLFSRVSWRLNGLRSFHTRTWTNAQGKGRGLHGTCLLRFLHLSLHKRYSLIDFPFPALFLDFFRCWCFCLN